MPQAPFFSIIIPVHNVEDYLPKCIASLDRQTLRDYEAILVDDVSTDGSRKLAESYVQKDPEHYRLICHPVNTRQGGARNTGIDAATGQYILFLDSDDYLKPQTLEVLASVIEKTQCDIVEFCHEKVDEQGNCLHSEKWPEHIHAPGFYDKPLLVSGMGPCNKACRAELFADPKMRFPEKLYYEDYCLMPRLLTAARSVYYINDPLYCYLQRTGSTTHGTNAQRNKDIMTCTDIMLDHFREKGITEALSHQLEYLAIKDVLLHATLRVNSIDRHSPIQKQLKDYVEKNFPNYRSNPYRSMLSKRYQRLLGYIENEQYTRLYIHWGLRNTITGRIKGILHRIKK